MSAVADEIWAILRGISETNRELAESHKQFKEEHNAFKEDHKAFREAQLETERIIKELQRETAREIKEVNKSIGRLTNRLGEFVEEAVRPAAVKLFRECGIDVHEVQQNIVVKRDGEGLEIDLLVVNDKDAVAIECKSNLSIDDVNEHLERLEKIKRLIPRYKENRILGAVAGMIIPENVAMYAIRKGLYVIGQNGDHLELRNEPSFAAKVW
ncbi:MAG: DUF3782 domain-containing protein [Methylococcales bacterium]|nr:DUF3782 domain-containing protein [Methylococcales bacterium]